MYKELLLLVAMVLWSCTLMAEEEDKINGFAHILRLEHEIQNKEYLAELKRLKKKAEAMLEQTRKSGHRQVSIRNHALLFDLQTEKVYQIPQSMIAEMYLLRDSEGFYFLQSKNKELDLRFKVAVNDIEPLVETVSLRPELRYFQEVKSPFNKDQEFLAIRHALIAGYQQAQREGATPGNGRKRQSDFVSSTGQVETSLSMRSHLPVDYGLIFSYESDLVSSQQYAYHKRIYYAGPIVAGPIASITDTKVFFEAIAQRSLSSQMKITNTGESWAANSYRLRANIRFIPEIDEAHWSYGAGISREWYQWNYQGRDETLKEYSASLFLSYEWEHRL